MSTELTVYLSFPGNTREAMEFYQSVFGGDLELLPYSTYQMDHMPADAIMHSYLSNNAGVSIMAADPPEAEYNPPSGFTLALLGDDASTLETWFEQLSVGGTVHTPLELHPWGDRFGICTDQFGMTWNVNIATSESGA